MTNFYVFHSLKVSHIPWHHFQCNVFLKFANKISKKENNFEKFH